MDENKSNSKKRKQDTALVIDDELSNRVILKSLLKRLGYLVLEAQSGRIGVDLFYIHKPDVVFMDVLMPEMDGYEATAKIKALAGERFVPVIFLTALTDEQALVRCIEVGGDDFLTKPFSPTILRSKLRALERIRSLHWEVDRLYSRMRLEEEMAQKVFSIAVVSSNVAMQQIPHRLQSAAIFSGDLLLTAWSPSGDLHLLLGDFTGHGLSAALGALPTAAVFRAMTAKGFPPERILAAMNEELHSLLPAGMFLAAIFVLVPKSLEYVQIFNSGLPDGLILDQSGAINQRVPSQLVPLGILPWQDMTEGRRHIPMLQDWRVLLISDGITEARSPNGELFGQEGFEAAIQASIGTSSVLNMVNSALDAFCQDAPQADDISLVEIPWTSVIFSSKTPLSTANASDNIDTPNPIAAHVDTNNMEVQWQVSISLRGTRLAKIDPVPVLISQIQELEDIGVDNNSIFNLLTKLYVTALDQCISRHNPNIDFNNISTEITNILEKRELHLAALPNCAEISIKVTCEQIGTMRRLLVCVVDVDNINSDDYTDAEAIWL